MHEVGAASTFDFILLWIEGSTTSFGVSFVCMFFKKGLLLVQVPEIPVEDKIFKIYLSEVKSSKNALKRAVV